ncbi:hypothetical protein [Corynebacterium flavescens]|uniref:hypothetical protein n=1 Tax=Corynebacterium flavescens TaxID=28028 RepID=UPI0026473E73|nr:hypothetical protein [Corynebacterium flavescens]MDN6822941.1 hypothetical protein [Corynebacterium flavescens]
MSKSLDLRPRIFYSGNKYSRGTEINPTDYAAKILAAEVGDAWLEMATEMQWSDATTISKATILRHFLSFFTADDATLSIKSAPPVLLSRLIAWEDSKLAPSENSTGWNREIVGQTKHIMRFAFIKSHIADTTLVNWANSPTRHFQVSHPLDEFSNSERIQLQNSCREMMRAQEAWLDKGTELLKQGKDPREFGWDSVENCLWALVHLTWQEIKEQRAGLLVDVAAARSELAEQVASHPLMNHATGNPLLLLLVPSKHYSIAARVLLHLQTGWSPEESSSIQLEDIEVNPEYVRILTRKNRAQRSDLRVLNTPPNSKGRGWNAADVVKRVLKATQLARTMNPSKSSFWLSANMSNAVWGSLDHFGEVPLIIDVKFHNNARLSQFTNFAGLKISKPIDFRRLRKTVKSVRSMVLGTLDGAAGNDHQTAVYLNHYAPTSSVMTIAAQTILRAQTKAFRAAHGAQVFNVSADEACSNTEKALSRIAQAVANESPVDSQMSVTACADPTQSPFEEAGNFCSYAPFKCFECSNAVVFKDHLPRLLAFKRFLTAQEKEMSPMRFHEVYGSSIEQLDSIIQMFSNRDIEAANQAQTTIHLPLRTKGRLQ